MTSPARPKHDHERTDASPGGIVAFAVSLAIVLGAVLAIALLAYRGMINVNDKSSSAPPLVAYQAQPPSPPLQPSRWHENLPYQDMEAFNREYDRLISTAGSEQMPDLQTHRRISVDDAMRLLAARGLPHDTATTIPSPQGTQPSIDTPYSNGGAGSVAGPPIGPAGGVPHVSQ